MKMSSFLKCVEFIRNSNENHNCFLLEVNNINLNVIKNNELVAKNFVETDIVKEACLIGW